MTPDASNEGEAPLTRPSQPQPNTKAKRRRGKRDSPLQLQFLTATDLSQFKDEKAMRCIRSQAMIHYRNQPDNKKKKNREMLQDAPAEKGSVMFDGHGEDEQYLYPSTSAAWWAVNSGLEQDARVDGEYPIRSSKGMKYKASDICEDINMRMPVKLAISFNIGDGVDPFVVLPQFRNPQLDSLFLVRSCMRSFSNVVTINKWFPAMQSHPHIMLSSSMLVCTWLDMNAGFSGDSKRTIQVKAETMKMINKRLRHPDTRTDDATLMVILHLLSGEMWSCNEKTLRIHVSGVVRLITQRGGMHRLPGLVADVAAACCYLCNIVCETRPSPIFQTWEHSDYVSSEDTTIPESPLFCPRPDFTTIINSSRCSQSTYDLLCDMRDLTNLFITFNADLDAIYGIDEQSTARLISCSVNYDAEVTEIRERLAFLPSAYTPGLPTSNDWVFEACRITALIYTAAIIMRVPFSVAADPSRNSILSDPRTLAKSDTDRHPATTRLTEALYEVLERTDTFNVWNGMSGVLYWVCAVGAAAARTPTSINMTQQPRFRTEAYTVWIRRCLIMLSTRTTIVMVFQHAVPFILSQKRLLKVQELIGQREARQLQF